MLWRTFQLIHFAQLGEIDRTVTRILNPTSLPLDRLILRAMAPTPVDASSDPLVILFKSIGLSQSKAVEANKNLKSALVLKDLIEKHNLVAAGLDEKQAVLVTSFAGNIAKTVAVGDNEKSFVVADILKGNLKSVDQVSGECSTTKLNR